ncbi:MAG: threonine aldolase family protein [Bacilli bacterium]|jgi:L-threonine aldolase, low-specificity|nr:aminotransferase class I/II-fold pyridoxal phosphate-dependent enzyme [Staphylococcus sp.]
MINLKNDYCYIAHPQIMEKLNQHFDNTYVGYGLDEHTKRASDLIKDVFKCKKADVYFLTGGTITNKILIAHCLKPFEAVISADSGHIHVHETGAIEATGHKVLIVNNRDGKVTADEVEQLFVKHTDEHMVKPKMLYISNPTEYGTIYSLSELKNLYDICKKLNMYLYVDGARLACALMANDNNIQASDLTKYVDAFYIGGTKNGLMMGEALVIINDKLKEEFRYTQKHFGGLLAKGFLCGLQFEALFENNLFFEIGAYQNNLAYLLTDGFKQLGIQFFTQTKTNQVFITIDNDIVEQLGKHVMFDIWEKGLKQTTIRLVTHYKLQVSHIHEVIHLLEVLIKARN